MKRGKTNGKLWEHAATGLREGHEGAMRGPRESHKLPTPKLTQSGHSCRNNCVFAFVIRVVNAHIAYVI